MSVREEKWFKKEIVCPLCGGDKFKQLGIRGNREYFGADPTATPHIATNVVECRTCRFIFTNPMIYGMEHLEHSYYNNPEKYQQDAQGNIPGMFGRRLDYISSFVKGKRILDVGAGKGEFLSMAKKRGWDVWGIEPSAEFCRYAKTKFGIQIESGYLKESSFKGQQFDLITLNHVLEHVDDPHALLKIISPFIAPGGVLFVEVPNTGSLLLKAADIYFRMIGLKWSSRLSPLHPPFHKYGYSKKSLRYLFNKSGYEVVHFRTYSGKDRGRKTTPLTFSVAMRDAASWVINLLGNRELLGAVAIVKHKK